MAERRFKRNSTSKKINALKLLFSNEHVIIFITEDKLQKAAYKLNQIITEYGLIISAHKTK